MKPTITRKFYVEWKGKTKWYRSCGYGSSRDAAVKIAQKLHFPKMHIVEVVMTEKVHKV